MLDKQRIVLFSFALLAFVGVFLLLPWSVATIVRLSKETATIAHWLDVVGKDWPNKDTYVKKKVALQESINVMRQRFIIPGQESKILSFISSRSKDFGLEIESFSPGKLEANPSKKNTQLLYLPISIKAQGKFNDLIAFFNYLQNSDYYLLLQMLQIKSAPPRHDITMTLNALGRTPER